MIIPRLVLFAALLSLIPTVDAQVSQSEADTPLTSPNEVRAIIIQHRMRKKSRAIKEGDKIRVWLNDSAKTITAGLFRFVGDSAIEIASHQIRFSEIADLQVDYPYKEFNLSKNKWTIVSGLAQIPTAGDASLMRLKRSGTNITIAGGALLAVGGALVAYGASDAFSLLGEGSPGAELFVAGFVMVVASVPLLAIGPIRLGKYRRAKRKAIHSGLYLSPGVTVLNDQALRPAARTSKVSFGATLKYEF